MEEILKLLEKLQITEDEQLINLKKQFYKIFCQYKFTKTNEEKYLIEYILPMIYKLYDKKILQKNLICLGYIAYNNLDVLQKCIKYDKTVFKLNETCSGSLYDYCIFKKQHWFYGLLKNNDIRDIIFNTDSYHKILTLKLIHATNLSEVDIEQVCILLRQIHPEILKDFWKYYVLEMSYLVEIFYFCTTIDNNININDFFSYACEHSSLCVLSKYSNFPYVEWNEILCKIYKEEDLHKKTNIQSECFRAFEILGNMFRLLHSDNRTTHFNVNYTVEDIKTEILNINNATLQVTLLENIFAIIFVRNSHLYIEAQEEFICKEKEVRLILHLLKLLVDEITIKNVYTKDSNEYLRFTNVSKHIADAMWRMELVANVKNTKKCETNILKYILAPPKSLIQMCLKKGDFKRAYQVIEIFSLDESFISAEINYTEKLQCLRDHLKRYFKIKTIRKVNPNISISNTELELDKTINDFIKNNPIIFDDEKEKLLSKLSKEHQFFTHFSGDKEIFMNLLDLAITQPKCIEDCEVLFQLLIENYTLENNVTSNYEKFYKKFIELYNDICHKECVTPGEILSLSYDLHLNRYKKEEEFYKRLAQTYDDFNNSLKVKIDGILDANHPSYKILLNLNTLCNDYIDFNYRVPDNIKYISKLYNYLKAFSKVLYIEEDCSDIVSKGKNTSFFDLLYHNRSELMGKLLFERHLDPSEFEKYFGKLKLDYLYHVVGNCFPTINLHTQENIAKEELYPENSLYVPSKSIITYIQKRNWLLAFMLNEIYKVDGVTIDVSEIRIQTFLNYIKLPKIQHLKVLFQNNEIVTSLQNEINTQRVSEYINAQILKHDYLISSNYSHYSYESLETGVEIIEGVLKSTNWKELFDILDNIPENQLKKNNVFLELRDMILVNIVQDGFETDCFKFVQLINDSDLRINSILHNMKDWPDEFCITVIKSEISKFDTSDNAQVDELKLWLQQIQLCKELTQILDVSSWSTAFESCKNRPEEVITKLLLSDKIDALLSFINLHKPNEDLLLKVDQNYFINLFNTSTTLDDTKKLLDYLPYNHTIKICYNLLKLLRKTDSLQFVVDYLLNNVKDDILCNVEIGLKMLCVFPQTEQEQFLSLIYKPIDIIETLVMNTKLDRLSAVLTVLQSELENREFSEDKLSTEKVDEVLRSYAEKSLDFRIITQPNPRLLRTPECKLMQSIDSYQLGTGNRGFIMPEEIPTKDKWIPNNEVLECMCCQQITFSMFNRRHHCRRCGRVVCYNCSLHRMLVQSYGDILVRVCVDCYEQTLEDGSTSQINDSISTKSMEHDYWFLSDDPEHNKIVREEFSYEHAPSVSLCLSIMKFHSKNVEYPKFLLDQCNIMLKLLQPSQEPVQEIDYLLVIKMLKSLTIAAKMSSIECTLHYGTSLADRILSQAELLGLLAERGCLNLLPVSSTNQCPYIDASILRKLRDRLLEREQWNLALEMSTKAGLDVTGVFAAWGKCCLKAGSLLVAREKFQRCLDKTGHYENLSDYNSQSDFDENSESLNKQKYTSKASSLNLLSDAKPIKNPPLLNEIIYILESKTVTIDSDVMKQTENQKLSGSLLSLSQSSGMSLQSDGAICILNKLKNLNNISSGNYYQSPNKNSSKVYPGRPAIDNIFYDECVYYLTRYGTHISLLEFYIKHGDIDRALNYIIDNQLSTDVFTDIYMRCLKDGIISILQEHMSKIDSTLDVWKNYLCCICRHLEKQQMLHSLYQLQQFMGDYIRAAMTCIRFYQENVQNFSDLAANVKFLYKAEEHLRHVLQQEQWVDVATVRRLSSASRESFEAKGITNPSLVMKMNANEIDKHINTIWRQKELVDFLVNCENCEIKPMIILSDIMPVEESASHVSEIKPTIPTVFGTTQDKLYLAVLAIICGNNMKDGFDIALRMIQDFKIKPIKVYCEAGKQLAKLERYNEIGQLVNCIKHSVTKDNVVQDMCDEMLSLAVATLTKANVMGTKVEDLIKLISDRSTKITAYIEAKQLKTAYYLAVKYKRMSDIRRILREAELLNQPGIKELCQKMLHSRSATYQRNS